MSDYTTMLDRLSDAMGSEGPLWKLVNAFCYFMALVCAMAAVFQLKDAAEPGGRGGYKAPLMSFLAAAMLAAIPSSYESVAVTFYGSVKSPLSDLKEDTSIKGFTALLRFVSFMGYVFFVRGVIALKEAGQPERYSQASVGKAATILIAGMAAIYMDVTLKFIGWLTGWDVSKYIN